jgi:hypothetical protein
MSLWFESCNIPVAMKYYRWSFNDSHGAGDSKDVAGTEGGRGVGTNEEDTNNISTKKNEEWPVRKTGPAHDNLEL